MGAEESLTHSRGSSPVFRLLFPDTSNPHVQGLLACAWLVAGWQERHLPKGKLQLGRTRLATMPGGNLDQTARLARKGAGLRQRTADLVFALLHAP